MVGSQRFFCSYDARPRDPLEERTTLCWVQGTAQLLNEALDENLFAHDLMSVSPGEPTTGAHFVALLPAKSELQLAEADSIFSNAGHRAPKTQLEGTATTKAAPRGETI